MYQLTRWTGEYSSRPMKPIAIISVAPFAFRSAPSLSRFQGACQVILSQHWGWVPEISISRSSGDMSGNAHWTNSPERHLRNPLASRSMMDEFPHTMHRSVSYSILLTDAELLFDLGQHPPEIDLLQNLGE